MKDMRIFALSAISLSLLALTACGEGYVPTQYTGFPYGNERTAGSGIAYVRASMMPEKGPVVDVAVPEAEESAVVEPAPEPEPEPVPQETFPDEAEKIFKEMQRK